MDHQDQIGAGFDHAPEADRRADLKHAEQRPRRGAARIGSAVNQRLAFGSGKNRNVVHSRAEIPCPGSHGNVWPAALGNAA